MRIEIGKESTPEEILEVIRNNIEGRFFVEDNKLYFDSDKTPILPPRDIRQIPQNYRQPSPTVNSNPFSRMGEQLNKMCGL